jgi:hypothetical protein
LIIASPTPSIAIFMNGTSSVCPPTTRIFRLGASAGTMTPSRSSKRGVRIVRSAPVSTMSSALEPPPLMVAAT